MKFINEDSYFWLRMQYGEESEVEFDEADFPFMVWFSLEEFKDRQNITTPEINYHVKTMNRSLA
ncbi:MAG: hypothetical protein ACFFDT_09545 [Candidatus Hodarchaeota archaeon]